MSTTETDEDLDSRQQVSGKKRNLSKMSGEFAGGSGKSRSKRQKSSDEVLRRLSRGSSLIVEETNELTIGGSWALRSSSVDNLKDLELPSDGDSEADNSADGEWPAADGCLCAEEKAEVSNADSCKQWRAARRRVRPECVSLALLRGSDYNGGDGRHWHAAAGRKRQRLASEMRKYDNVHIFADERCLLHEVADELHALHFNERPDRLRSLFHMVYRRGWDRLCHFHKGLTLNGGAIPQVKDLEGVHLKSYLNDLRSKCRRLDEGEHTAIFGDTYLCPRTFDAAAVSAALVIEAVKYVIGEFFDDGESMSISPRKHGSGSFLSPRKGGPKHGGSQKTKDKSQDEDDENMVLSVSISNSDKDSDADKREEDTSTAVAGKHAVSFETKCESDDCKSTERSVADGNADSGETQQRKEALSGDSVVSDDVAKLSLESSAVTEQCPVQSDAIAPSTPVPSLKSQGTEVIDSEKEEEGCEEAFAPRYAVVLNRPPGHHCGGSKMFGYCMLNNTALAIEKCLSLEAKVLILDIDIHHGDGTQSIFYNDANVLTVSFHELDNDFFPQTGERNEYGPSRRHAAYGRNINVPLKEGATDYDVMYALRNLVWPIVDQFSPDIAFYALGTDGVEGDKAKPDTKLTPLLFGSVAFELKAHASRIVVTTEGGYSLSYLTQGMDLVLRALADDCGHKSSVFPQKFPLDWVRQSTLDCVRLTRSDLNRVWMFPPLICADASEFKSPPVEVSAAIADAKVRKEMESGLQQSVTDEGSFYVPTDSEMIAHFGIGAVADARKEVIIEGSDCHKIDDAVAETKKDGAIDAFALEAENSVESEMEKDYDSDDYNPLEETAPVAAAKKKRRAAEAKRKKEKEKEQREKVKRQRKAERRAARRKEKAQRKKRKEERRKEKQKGSAEAVGESDQVSDENAAPNSSTE